MVNICLLLQKRNLVSGLWRAKQTPVAQRLVSPVLQPPSLQVIPKRPPCGAFFGHFSACARKHEYLLFFLHLLTLPPFYSCCFPLFLFFFLSFPSISVSSSSSFLFPSFYFSLPLFCPSFLTLAPCLILLSSFHFSFSFFAFFLVLILLLFFLFLLSLLLLMGLNLLKKRLMPESHRRW